MAHSHSHPANLHLDSRVIHGGQRPDPTTGAVMPPIYTSSTFAQESPGVHKGFEYSRSHNVTRFAFERCLANIEGSPLTEADDTIWRSPNADVPIMIPLFSRNAP